jgi:putative Mn2+ efflux pump MntP
MNILEVVFIALALAVDAFAVSLGAGSFFGKATPRQKFRLSFHFGLFQFMMPIVGWLAGAEIEQFIRDFDHWVAFGILALIGGKMIYDATTAKEEPITTDVSKGFPLVSLSIATSIDALAVGFSIGVVRSTIFYPSVVIGITASAMSLLGIYLGEKLSAKFGGKISIFGGIVLILIGANIVREHLNLF